MLLLGEKLVLLLFQDVAGLDLVALGELAVTEGLIRHPAELVELRRELSGRLRQPLGVVGATREHDHRDILPPLVDHTERGSELARHLLAGGPDIAEFRHALAGDVAKLDMKRVDLCAKLAILRRRGAKRQINQVAGDREVVHELVEPHTSKNLGLHVGHEFRIRGGRLGNVVDSALIC